jgi:endonuclease/exonuclease/phosphatase family metal-dependent hydrolase
MPRWILPLLFAACLHAEPVRLRILSYNIRHAEGTDSKLDPARIAHVIRQADPDFVALQEVDVRTTRVAGADLAHQLAATTGLHAVFGKTIDYHGGWYGNAILSRWPLAGFVNHALPFTPGREARAVIEADTAKGFRLLATHLDITEPDRLLAAARIKELITGPSGGVPMVLAGDLNATPGSATMKALLADWSTAALDQPLPTIPSAAPARQIDYILFRPANRWHVVEVRVLDEPVASDHRPILAVLELLEPAEKIESPRLVRSK